MTRVYALKDDGKTEPMDNIHCVNEELELQRILEINPDLIPGDQINPSDPRRWLIVKREMPVPPEMVMSGMSNSPKAVKQPDQKEEELSPVELELVPIFEEYH